MRPMGGMPGMMPGMMPQMNQFFPTSGKKRLVAKELVAAKAQILRVFLPNWAQQLASSCCHITLAWTGRGNTTCRGNIFNYRPLAQTTCGIFRDPRDSERLGWISNDFPHVVFSARCFFPHVVFFRTLFSRAACTDPCTGSRTAANHVLNHALIHVLRWIIN